MSISFNTVIPTAIPTLPTSGLILDLWASAGVTDVAGDVTDWVDQVGPYTFSQSTAASQPILLSNWTNSRPAIEFDGSNDFLEATFTADQLQAAGQDLTVYLIGELDALSSAIDNSIFDFDNGRTMLLLESNAAGFPPGWNSGGWKGVTTDATPGAPKLWAWSLVNGGNGEVFENSVSLGTAAYTGVGLGGTTAIGANSSGSLYNFDGKIGRLLIYDNAHGTGATYDEVVDWANHYYNLGI